MIHTLPFLRRRFRTRIRALRARHVSSLKRLLLLWIIPVLLTGAVVGQINSGTVLTAQVEAAYDRSLAGVLRAIDLNISTQSGGLALAQPYQLLDFFELTASGNVYYRIATEDGLAEIGYPALPMPDAPLPSDKLIFFDGAYLDGEPVRVAVMARELDPPLHHDLGASRRVIIQVAESLETRRAYIRDMLLQSFWRDLAVIVLTAGLLVLAVVSALRPLRRLRQALRARDPDDLRPMSTRGIPAEVRPLVEAINHHMDRYAHQAQRQRQFLDDASHQLRTPLTLLRTQIGYAQREQDIQEMRQALNAMQSGLDRAIRVTNQMLALARAHGAALPETLAARDTFDLCALVEESVRLMLPAARKRGLEYGLDLPPRRIMVRGMRLLLQEAIVNILDNAIRYSPPGGAVAVDVLVEDGLLRIVVQDNGPGMTDADIAKAGVRFRRGEAGRQRQGAGLGLAIVAAIVRLHQGEMRLARCQDGPGLRVELVFSLAEKNGFSAVSGPG